MAIRTSLLTTRNINLDTDFSKYIETVSEPWVIEGFALANSKIGLWKARVPCERTNWETIYALVQNFNEVSISGNGHVIISISQTIIDDWSLWNEDWTWIATVEVVSELPTKNYLELYEISELGLITDKRNMIKKVGELNTAIETLQSQVSDLDDRVEALETAWAINHLEEQGLVWELYTVNDTLFKQKTPKLSNCTVEDCKVWNTNDNKEIHIQRIASWQASDTLKLKVKAVWSPTTALKVEVRSWIQVTVTADTEAYWYWDSENILATWSIVYGDITTDWQEIEVELDNYIWWTKGDLLSIVCYQESSWSVVVNADNYYILACDSTQWSEAFSYVSVNGSTRTRSKLMPYCIGDWLEQTLLVKVSSAVVTWYNVAVFNFPDKYSFSWNSAWNDIDAQVKIINPNSTNSLSIKFTIEDLHLWYSNYPTYTYAGYYLWEYTNKTQFASAWSSDTHFRPYTSSVITLPAWSTFWFVYWWNNNANHPWRWDRTWTVIQMYGTLEIHKWVEIKLLPREAEDIWESAFTTSLWRHTDWEWFDWTKSSSTFKKEMVIDIKYNSSWSYTIPCDWFITYEIYWGSSSYPTKIMLNWVTYLSAEADAVNKWMIPVNKWVVISCTTTQLGSNYAKIVFNAYQDF